MRVGGLWREFWVVVRSSGRLGRLLCGFSLSFVFFFRFSVSGLVRDFGLFCLFSMYSLFVGELGVFGRNFCSVCTSLFF